MDETPLPYIRINQVKKFISEMPKETCNIEDLTTKFGRSNVTNALPTLTLLKLIEYNKREKKVSLTENARKFRIALITGDHEKASEIIKNIIGDIEVFAFVRGLLERKGSITVEEIGKEIAFKYNKTWKNPVTYRAYGSACASILGFAGYGIYERGVLRKGSLSVEKDKKLPSPYVSLRKIIKILKEVGNEEIDLHTLSERLNTHENRLGAELSVCVELGVIERLAPGKFILTKKGKELIDPLKAHQRKEIWKEILLESRYRKIITLLSGEEFDFNKLGEILKHHFGGKWKEENTINTFTKKFLNWLKEADILEEKEGKYKLVVEIEKINKSKERTNEKNFVGLALMDYYFIGKNVGIISASNNFDEIDEAVSELINTCKHDKSLAEITELLEQHLDLFRETKLPDGRIFLPDIKLLEKRLGLVKENGV